MTEMERLKNESVVFEIGTRGRTRVLKLCEPPMMDMLDFMQRGRDKLVEAYRKNTVFFDALISEGASALSLVQMPMITPVFGELCEAIDMLDADREHADHRVAELISTAQFIKILPVAFRLINIEEIKANFSEALEALKTIGLKVEITPEAESEEKTPPEKPETVEN